MPARSRGGGGTPAAYKAHLRCQAVRSIVEAASLQEEAEARAGSVRLRGLTRNRRGWDSTDEALTAVADGHQLGHLRVRGGPGQRRVRLRRKRGRTAVH